MPPAGTSIRSSVGINYDHADRRTSLTLPNGVTVGYSVDNDSRITGLTYSAGNTQLGNLTYGYDADGRVTSKNGTLAAIGLLSAVNGDTFNANNGMTYPFLKPNPRKRNGPSPAWKITAF